MSHPPLNIDRDSLVRATVFLVECLCRLEEMVKAREVLKNTSYLLEDDPDIAEWRRCVDGMLSHLDNPEAYRAHYAVQWEANTPANREQVLQAAAFHPRSAWALQLLRDHGVASCIDLGAGNGYLSLFLALHGIRATGINLTEGAVAACQGSALALGLPATFILGAAETVPDEARGTFDAACAFEIAEHVPDDRVLVAAMRAYVRPGGLLLMTVPAGACSYGEDHWANLTRPPDTPQAHIRAYTERTLRALLADLEDVTVTRQLAMQQPGSPMVFAAVGRNP